MMADSSLTWFVTWVVLTLGSLLVFAVIFPWLWRAVSRAAMAPSAAEMTAWEALDYIRHRSSWGGRAGPEPSKPRAGGGVPSLAEVAAELVRAARDGQVTVAGRREGATGYEEIPPRFWETNGLDAGAYAAGGSPDPSEGGRTEPATSGPGTDVVYVGLRLLRDQVTRTWPPTPRAGAPSAADPAPPRG